MLHCTDVASALGIDLRIGEEIVFRAYHDPGRGGGGAGAA